MSVNDLMAGYQETRQRHVGQLMGILPEHIQRLRWAADRIRHEREARLRLVPQLERQATGKARRFVPLAR